MRITVEREESSAEVRRRTLYRILALPLSHSHNPIRRDTRGRSEKPAACVCPVPLFDRFLRSLKSLNVAAVLVNQCVVFALSFRLTVLFLYRR